MERAGVIVVIMNGEWEDWGEIVTHCVTEIMFLNSQACESHTSSVSRMTNHMSMSVTESANLRRLTRGTLNLILSRCSALVAQRDVRSPIETDRGRFNMTWVNVPLASLGLRAWLDGRGMVDGQGSDQQTRKQNASTKDHVSRKWISTMSSRYTLATDGRLLRPQMQYRKDQNCGRWDLCLQIKAWASAAVDHGQDI